MDTLVIDPARLEVIVPTEDIDLLNDT